MNKEEILKRGSVEVHIKVGGIRQLHMLKVEKEKTAWGLVPFCVFSTQVPAGELVRVAEELQLPVKCKGMKVFPKGKGPADFAEPEAAPKPKSLAHSKIVSSRSSGSGEDESEEDDSDDELEDDDSEDEETEEQTEEEDQDEETDEEGEKEPVEESEPDGKAPSEPEGEEEEEEWEEKQPEGEEGPQKPEPKKDETEVEGSMDEDKKQEGQADKPKRKFLSGVLSEGIIC